MSVKLSLENEEALILYDLLSQIDDEGELTIGPAEKELIKAFIGLLEGKLAFAPDADYDELLSAAREQVIGKFGES